MTDRVSYGGVEDRTMPAVVYALYLLGIANGLTFPSSANAPTFEASTARLRAASLAGRP